MREADVKAYLAAGAGIERQLYKFALYQLGDERAAAEVLRQAYVAAYATGAPAGESRAFALNAFAAAWEACRFCVCPYALHRPPITDLLRAAPLKRRAAFVLTAICRFDARDAARILGIPEQAVRQSVRALAQASSPYLAAAPAR